MPVGDPPDTVAFPYGMSYEEYTRRLINAGGLPLSSYTTASYPTSITGTSDGDATVTWTTTTTDGTGIGSLGTGGTIYVDRDGNTHYQPYQPFGVTTFTYPTTFPSTGTITVGPIQEQITARPSIPKVEMHQTQDLETVKLLTITETDGKFVIRLTIDGPEVPSLERPPEDLLKRLDREIKMALIRAFQLVIDENKLSEYRRTLILDKEEVLQP